MTPTRRMAVAVVMASLILGTPAVAVPSSPNPRWHDCVVTYRVTAEGHTTRHLRAAIRDVERATGGGLDFRATATATADLTIRLSSRAAPRHLRAKGRGNYGLAEWHIAGGKITRAKITIFRVVHSRTTATQRNVYRHELGHVLGLKHASARSRDVMNPRITPHRTPTRWRQLLRARYRHCRTPD